MRTARRALAAVLSLAALSCGGDAGRIPLQVIAPAGGDPFDPGRGATHARITLEGQGEPTLVPVASDGSFTFELRPMRTDVRSRLVIEAVRGEEVLGSGATPPVYWSSGSTATVRVLMHLPDSVVAAPGGGFATPRAGDGLIPLGTELVFSVALAPGGSAARAPEGYNLVSHEPKPFLQPVPAVFDGDTAVIPLAAAWMLQRFEQAVLFTDATNMAPAAAMGVPPERQALAAPTVIEDVVRRGGAWLLGGIDAQGVRSTRVDQVSTTGTFTALSPGLAIARRRPIAIAVQRSNEVPDGQQWLLVGGQREGDPLLEVYAPVAGVAATPLRTGDDAIDLRTDAAAVCLEQDTTGCTKVLVLGGRNAQGGIEEDVVLDGTCARRRGDGCTLVLARGAWLARPRAGARAAYAEGPVVLVAGGVDASGAARTIETIDVRNPVAPQRGRIVATLEYDDPSLTSLYNGSVMIAGGRGASGEPRSEIWFYRH